MSDKNNFFTIMFVFVKFLLTEFISPIVYIGAIIVGAAINLLSGYGFPGNIVPYIVPIIVQVFTKTAIRFKNRKTDILLQLPARRKAPAFVMNTEGEIVAMIGHTARKLKKLGLTNMRQIIDEECFDYLYKEMHKPEPSFEIIEAYSKVINCKYEIRTTSLDDNNREFLVWCTDITKLSEERLALKSLSNFVENNPAPVLRVKRDGIIIGCNAAAESELDGKLLNRNIFEVIPVLEKTSFSNIEIENVQIEVKVSEKTILFTIKLDKKSDTVFIYGSDITDLKKIEEQLDRQAQFVKKNPAPVIQSGKGGLISNYNPAAREVFGGDLENKIITSLFPGLNESRMKELQENNHIQIEEKIGSKYYLFTLKCDTNSDSVYVYGSDITTHVETNVKLRVVETGINQAYDAFVITDNKGTFQYVNPAFEQLTGHLATDILGKSYRILKSKEQDKEFYKNMQDTILRGDIWSGLLRNKKKSGLLYFEEMSITPIKNDQGRITNFVSISRDITEKKELENKMESLRKEYESFMRHELKNYLTPIQGFVQLLQMTADANLDEKQKGYLDKINVSIKNIDGLIDNLKRLQDFEQGKYDLETERYDLNSVVKQNAIDLKLLADKFDVKLDYSEYQGNSYMEMDTGFLPGVFQNLIKNAIEHVENLIESSEKVVRIKMFCENEKVVITINNKGKPIPSAKLQLFFEKFNSDRTTKKGGTGLGTSYAYLVTKAHGGDISVESNENDGTTVTLKFNVER